MITKETQRVLWDDSSTLRDISNDINDFRASEVNLSYSSGDYLYIGSEMPFGFRYFDLPTPSTEDVSISIEHWDGNTWKSFVDILDGTNGFKNSGYISWRIDKNQNNWHLEDDSKDISSISTTRIYYMYWLRISFSGDLSATTSLNTINFKFSNDDALYGIYPDLNDQEMRDAFERTAPPGTKTTWDEQSYIASEAIVRDLKSRNLAFSGNQIIDYEMFEESSLHKIAEIIYGAFGSEGFNENRQRAKKYYEEAFNQGFLRLDLNKNTISDPFEKKVRQVNLER